MSPVLWYFRIGKAEIRNNRIGPGAKLFCAAVERCMRVGADPAIIITIG